MNAEKLREVTGIDIHREPIALESGQAHDDTFSYCLCQRYYDNPVGLSEAINLGNQAIAWALRNKGPNLAKLYEFVGDMLYLKGDCRMAAGYFMKALTYSRSDINPWINLLFSLRSIGEFDLFEEAVFNFDSVYRAWEVSREPEMTQEIVNHLIRGR